MTHRIGTALMAWFIGFIVILIIMAVVPGLPNSVEELEGDQRR